MNEKIKILYVEDEPKWQEKIKNSISPDEFFVEFAFSYEKAIEKLRSSFYHIALLDKKLTEDATNADGLKIAKHISQLDEGTHMIVFTSYGKKLNSASLH